MSKNMLSVLRGNFLDRGVRKLVGRLSEFPGKTAGAVVKKPQCFLPQILAWLAGLENDHGWKFLQNLESGATIGYIYDLGNFPESPTEIKTAFLRRTERESC